MASASAPAQTASRSCVLIRPSDCNNYHPPPRRGGLFMPSRPSSVGGYVLILPGSFPPLAWPPMASRRHFCAHAQQGMPRPKRQDCRKGHLRARIAILAPSSVPIFPRRKTPHRGPQNAQQRHKEAPAHSTREKAGALSFVAGDGQHRAAALVSVPPGAICFFAQPEALFQRAKLPMHEAVIVDSP